jgi:hypothetical protein
MDFQIGQEVNLNNKRYTIAGTVKRSFLLERNGKTYKATSAMMKKIQEQNKLGVGMSRRKRQTRSTTFHMEKRLAHKKIFNPDAKMPETEEELMKELDGLCCELSPENLSCDGEISRTAIRQKASAIRAEWKEIERKLGRKVSEEEAESHWLTEMRKPNIDAGVTFLNDILKNN